jgi:hypothetical protein
METPPPPGRPAGRALSEHELVILHLLLELQGRASEYAGIYGTRFEDFVLECREAGCSVRGIADALEVSPSQVQRWTVAARDRRDG